MAKFDSKTWNDEVFQKYMKKVEPSRENALIKSSIFDNKANAMARTLDEQVGGNYIVEPIKGVLNGDVQNYDGVEDVEATSRDTFEQGKIVVGRMKGWTEKDFSSELTGEDFMPMAQEVSEYYEAVDQDDLLAILSGIFATTDTGSADFVSAHTYEHQGTLGATTINKAITKACGDKKAKFRLIFINSADAEPLEELQLVDFLKYTDKDGITRDLTIGQYNGRLMVIDDTVPAGTVYIVGEKFIEYDNIGAKKPSEMARDPFKNGGLDTLITRQRKLYAPKYISFTKASMKTDSPTKAELADGKNWAVVNNGKSGEDKKYINHKLIPVARIVLSEVEPDAPEVEPDAPDAEPTA